MWKAFFFLATFYTGNGPVVYVLDSGLSGHDCIARMRGGLTESDAHAIAVGNTRPAGESHVPPRDWRPDLSRAVLSCEFEW